MENSKNINYNIKVLRFIEKHHVTPENAQVARAIVEGNMRAVENCVRKGAFSDKRFIEILGDPILQATYAEMAEALDNGDVRAFEPLYNRIKDEADMFCGWLTFYNQHLEMTLDLDLVKRTRLDYHFQDYRENN